MSFIQPIPCSSGGEEGACCPHVFTGYCLADGTPIAITLFNGVQTTWTNLLTGVVTPGPPPPGTGVCSPGNLDCTTDSVTICPGEDPIPVTVEGLALNLSCETDSVTICPGEVPIPVTVEGLEFNLSCETDSVTICPGEDPIVITGTVSVEGLAVSLNCETDSVTICPGDDPIEVVGTVTVDQGTSPWTVDGTVELGATTLAALETVTVNQGTSPWVVGATDLDIRDLTFATDSVDVTGSEVSLDAATLAALETVTVLQGTSPWIVSATDLDIRALDCATDSVTICPGEDPILVTFDGTIAVSLDCATDSVTICPGEDPIDVTGTVELGATTLAALETITVNQGTSPWIIDAEGGSLTVDAVALDIRTLDCSIDSVTICPGEDPIDVTGSEVSLDAATLAALETVTVIQGTSPWIIDAVALDIRALDCATDSVTICPGDDPIEVEGTVELGATTLAALETITVLQGTSPWVIGDGGSSITIDNAALSVVGGGVEATALRVTIASDSTGLLSVDDNGGSLTVDASNLDIRDLVFATDKVDVSGSAIAVPYDYAEDTGHTTGDVGAFILAVRNDAAAALTTTTLDYSPIAVDSAGRVGISDLGGSITIDGTVELGATTLAALETTTVLQGTSPWVISGAVTNTVLSVVGGGTEATAQRVTIANDSTGVLSVDDNGGSLTVDNPVLSVVGGGTEATAQRVTIANDSTGVLSVDDNGASLTVDNPVLSVVGGGTEATAQRVTIANDSTGVLSVDDNGGSLTVDGTVTATLASTFAEDTGHTTGASGQFVLAVRNDAAATLTTTTLDYSPIAVDAAGRVGISDLGGSLTVDFTMPAENRPATGTLSNVSASLTSVTLQASNASRRGLTIVNESAAELYVKFGATASVTSYTVKLSPGAYYEAPFPCYTGVIDGIWTAASGTARVTETT